MSCSDLEDENEKDFFNPQDYAKNPSPKQAPRMGAFEEVEEQSPNGDKRPRCRDQAANAQGDFPERQTGGNRDASGSIPLGTKQPRNEEAVVGRTQDFVDACKEPE